jgi:hypothetical protein
MIPTGRETYGANLVSNEEDIKNQLAKFKEEWPTHGVIIMCNLWTGTIGINIINFMVYYNGIMLFHISVDWTRHIKDTYFIYGVTTLCQNLFFLSLHQTCLLVFVILVWCRKSTKWSFNSVFNISCRA